MTRAPATLTMITRSSWLMAHVLEARPHMSERAGESLATTGSLRLERRTDVRSVMHAGAILVRARPGLALADEAAERAALEVERARAGERDRARVGLAVLGVVDLPVPFVGRAARLHVEDDLHADHRAAALGRVRVVGVGLRPLGLRVDRLLQADDGAAQRRTAFRDGHLRLGVLGQPVAGGITRHRGRDGGETKQ